MATIAFGMGEAACCTARADSDDEAAHVAAEMIIDMLLQLEQVGRLASHSRMIWPYPSTALQASTSRTFASWCTTP